MGLSWRRLNPIVNKIKQQKQTQILRENARGKVFVGTYICAGICARNFICLCNYLYFLSFLDLFRIFQNEYKSWYLCAKFHFPVQILAFLFVFGFVSGRRSSARKKVGKSRRAPWWCPRHELCSHLGQIYAAFLALLFF